MSARATPPPWPPLPPLSEFRLDRGGRTLWCAAGGGDGPVAVFTHGAGLDGRCFGPQLRLLAARVATWDLPRHGRSDSARPGSTLLRRMPAVACLWHGRHRDELATPVRRHHKAANRWALATLWTSTAADVGVAGLRRAHRVLLDFLGEHAAQ
ncbi:alpha/beta fold hydrolase [Actinokineospora bangkokensis]|uniref:Alpha/beta hydrolase n=1 Tax=Actinokineospora bangkokensis TaxID=1193682 RepID=A0A1Q9LMP5_9PSEU|nr:hypothetical protein [Actinokineospora bangkokensis]OLR93316.1 hypothetical protein BJP25_17730 [Actinokineospora bangkokensis]